MRKTQDIQRDMLILLNRRSTNVCEGAANYKDLKARRAKNKVARVSRRKNRR